MLFEFNEFRLTLADDWKQWMGPEPDTLLFHSEQRRAGITISAQFYQVPADKMQELAERILQSRASAHAHQLASVQYLQRSINPHSSGDALEIFYAAQSAQDRTFCFLGYVTSRKILNFFIETAESDVGKAETLFTSVLAGYEPLLP